MNTLDEKGNGPVTARCDLSFEDASYSPYSYV